MARGPGLHGSPEATAGDFLRGSCPSPVSWTNKNQSARVIIHGCTEMTFRISLSRNSSSQAETCCPAWTGNWGFTQGTEVGKKRLSRGCILSEN